ncbi:MAG: electron transfer flavoprotein subunit beta/FixA family protein [Clostridiales Family XIII bacterium]|jgi:electron transfer flavoprotein beta subunit|nr:electron transfer flavoprotein subunit beta/FixA family protein [Clostridiales Family XIII bacterium]
MKVVVCIKQVPASNRVAADPVTHHLMREKSDHVINPADLNALEAAFLLKEALESSDTACEITALSMGPPDAEEALREAVSRGADEACLLSDRLFAGSDTIATAAVLMAGVRYLGTPDLILTGAESSDGATGQIAPMLAESLGLPHVTNVCEIETCLQSGLTVRKHFRRSDVRLRIDGPAVLSVGYGCNEPRLPTLRSKMLAKKKAVRILTNKDLLLPENGVGAAGSPTEVTDSFSPENKGSCAWMQGDAAQVAEQILSLIKKEMCDK